MIKLAVEGLHQRSTLRISKTLWDLGNFYFKGHLTMSVPWPLVTSYCSLSDCPSVSDSQRTKWQLSFRNIWGLGVFSEKGIVLIENNGCGQAPHLVFCVEMSQGASGILLMSPKDLSLEIWRAAIDSTKREKNAMVRVKFVSMTIQERIEKLIESLNPSQFRIMGVWYFTAPSA